MGERFLATETLPTLHLAICSVLAHVLLLCGQFDSASILLGRLRRRLRAPVATHRIPQRAALLEALVHARPLAICHIRSQLGRHISRVALRGLPRCSFILARLPWQS